MKNTIIISFAVLLLGGCQSVSTHREAVSDTSVNNLTVGVVQQEVRVGMSSASVVEMLGSPNIVSTDDQRREVWVYDKISTDTAYSTSSGGVSALILGGLTGVPLGAGAGGSYSKNTGASSKSQKTLTVIIKFDKSSKVRDFAYHTSRF